LIPGTDAKRVLAVALVCGGLIGCGGTGTVEPAPERTIPKDLFIGRADKLCAHAYRRAARLKTPSLSPQSRGELRRVATFLRAQVAIGSRELARIRRLGRAVPGSRLQAQNLATADRIVHTMDEIADHAERGELGRVRAKLVRLRLYSRRAITLAKRFGYRVCGQGGIHRVLNR
jgi:hypothetical protein